MIDTWDFDARHRNTVARNTVAGEELVIVAALPWRLNAFRPNAFVFDDAVDWQVQEVLLFFDKDRATNWLDAPRSARLLNEAPRLHCQTIQRRQLFGFRVAPQKHGLGFRCTVGGESVPSTMIDRAAGVFGDSDVAVHRACDFPYTAFLAKRVSDAK